MGAAGWIQKVQEEPETVNDLELHKEIEEGFSWELAESTKELLDLNDEQLADLLGVTKRTVSNRRKENKRIDSKESDQLFRTIMLFSKACRFFGDRESTLKWMNREQPSLNMLKPIEITTTEVGAREVEDVIERMEHSVVL